MKKTVTADIVIFGGGIAGLWLLSRLRQSGLSAILFESGGLGGGQTLKSQGIIHGGLKYALQGVLTTDAKAMADMPKRWRDCLSGQGEIDLSNVPVLSPQQYLFSTNKFTAKLTGFLASASLSSKVEPLKQADYPNTLQHPSFKGDVFGLDEIVIDVPNLVRELVKTNQDAIFKYEPLSENAFTLSNQGEISRIRVSQSGNVVDIIPQHVVFSAGAGNEYITHLLKANEITMQRRPLHMVMIKMPMDYPLYAHCLGLGSRPRLTITTHYMQDGSTIWYLGGLLAEDGVKRSGSMQIQAAREECTSLFPWIDFSAANFASFMVDRAEPRQKNGLKPETACAKVMHNMTFAWPTKLALAPKLADDILQHLQDVGIKPKHLDTRELRAWPMPPLAKPIWEDVFCKHVA